MPPVIATVSKYPPYISGHASQAVWNNTALAQLTGDRHHQITYCGVVPPPFDDVPAHVHHIGTSTDPNPKAPDGHLIKAIAGRLTRLAAAGQIDAILAMYADPHAEAALRARRAAGWSGRRIPVVVTVEGSDLTASMAGHRHDGEAAVLLADVLAADAVFAVSRHVRAQTIGLAADLLGAPAAELAAGLIRVRYPGLPPQAFHAPPPSAQQRWREQFGVPQTATVVSAFTRLVPEKGMDLLVDLAALARRRHVEDLFFVIAGTGPHAPHLARRIADERLANAVVLCDLDPNSALALRATSALGIFPSRHTRHWHETFGIAALEYQALGVPALVSDGPGFGESTPDGRFRVPAGADLGLWWQHVARALADRAHLSADARRFAAQFTSARAARQLLAVVADPARPRPSAAIG